MIDSRSCSDVSRTDGIARPSSVESQHTFAHAMHSYHRSGPEVEEFCRHRAITLCDRVQYHLSARAYRSRRSQPVDWRGAFFLVVLYRQPDASNTAAAPTLRKRRTLSA